MANVVANIVASFSADGSGYGLNQALASLPAVEAPNGPEFLGPCATLT
jgi:hypothetical protein